MSWKLFQVHLPWTSLAVVNFTSTKACADCFALSKEVMKFHRRTRFSRGNELSNAFRCGVFGHCFGVGPFPSCPVVPFLPFWGRVPLYSEPTRKGCPFLRVGTGHLIFFVGRQTVWLLFLANPLKSGIVQAPLLNYLQSVLGRPC